MVDETNSNVFGPTLNPCNLRLTAGGSSGGEGALVALKGSIIGVGTDWGASHGQVIYRSMVRADAASATS